MGSVSPLVTGSRMISPKLLISLLVVGSGASYQINERQVVGEVVNQLEPVISQAIGNIGATGPVGYSSNVGGGVGYSSTVGAPVGYSSLPVAPTGSYSYSGRVGGQVPSRGYSYQGA